MAVGQWVIPAPEPGSSTTRQYAYKISDFSDTVRLSRYAYLEWAVYGRVLVRRANSNFTEDKRRYVRTIFAGFRISNRSEGGRNA